MSVDTLIARLTIQDRVFDRISFFREVRHLGRPPELAVTFEAGFQPDGSGIIGHEALFELSRADESPRYFKGVVETAKVRGSSMIGDALHEVTVRIVPQMELLRWDVGCEIHQEMNVKAIVEKVLNDRGMTDQDWRLTGDYLDRVYCVQYCESALDFISRLLQEEGIYYFVEMSADASPKMIFCDDSTAAAPLAPAPELPFRPGDMDVVGNHVRSVSEQHCVRSGKFTLRDYDFERPDLDQTAEAEADVDSDLEVYDYPGGYIEPSEGKRRAQVRLEAEQVARHMLEIEADCPQLTAGIKVTIEDALHEEMNGDFLVTSVTQEINGDSYHARAWLLPIDIKYRSRCTTPRPIIEGPQTATVVAPEGSPEEEIHTDEWGRAKVKFHWDLAPVNDDKASCWMRTKQMQTSGSMILPRVGWEVVIEFLEGDPDKPLITGRMYNGIYMPPYVLPEGKTRTTYRSNTTPDGGGFNEIRFEDKAGGEEIYIHAQYDMVVTAANNKSKSVGNQESRNIAVDSTLDVGADQTVQITMGNNLVVGADQKVTVGSNRKVEVNALQNLKVGGNSTTTVGANHFEMDGDPLTALVNLAVEKVTEVAQAKAAEQLAKVDEYVQGKVDQVMGPINNMQEQVNSVADAMDQVSQGHLGEVSTALREAAALPQVDELGGQMREAAFGGSQAAGDAIGVEVNAPEEGAEGFSAQTGLDQLVDGAIERGVRAGGDVVDDALHDVFGEALGLDAEGDPSESLKNVAGPELDNAGIDETDRDLGPGHSLTVVEGNLDEVVGTAKIVAAITGINTEVAGNLTQTVGIGKLEAILGDRNETVDSSKDETCTGLVVLSKGDVSEKVSGSRTCMVGGAIVDLITGGHTIESGGPATFIGALHKIEAKSKITFKVGDSECVIEGGGITFKAPIVSVMSPKIQLTKKVAQN